MMGSRMPETKPDSNEPARRGVEYEQTARTHDDPGRKVELHQLMLTSRVKTGTFDHAIVQVAKFEVRLPPENG